MSEVYFVISIYFTEFFFPINTIILPGNQTQSFIAIIGSFFLHLQCYSGVKRGSRSEMRNGAPSIQTKWNRAWGHAPYLQAGTLVSRVSRKVVPPPPPNHPVPSAGHW